MLEILGTAPLPLADFPPRSSSCVNVGVFVG